MNKQTSLVFIYVIFLGFINSFFIKPQILYANTFRYFSKQCREEYDRENYKKALEFCDNAIVLNSNNNPEIFAQRALIKHFLNDNYGSISDLSKAIEINPKTPYFYWNRALSFERIGDMESACNDLKVGSNLNHKKSTERYSSIC